LQFLTNAQIEKVLAKYRKTRSTEIAERLLEELARLGDPDQDNISFTVIKVNDASVRPKQNRPARDSLAVARPRGLTVAVTEPIVVPLPGLDDLPEARPEQVATLAASIAGDAGAEVRPLEAELEGSADRSSVVPRRFVALG
jgi:hypothetical protein